MVKKNKELSNLPFTEPRMKSKKKKGKKDTKLHSLARNPTGTSIDDYDADENVFPCLPLPHLFYAALCKF